MELVQIVTVKSLQRFEYTRRLEQQIQDQQFPDVQRLEMANSDLTIQKNIFRRAASEGQEEARRTIEAYEIMGELERAKAELNIDVERLNNRTDNTKKANRQLDTENRELAKEKKRLTEKIKRLVEEKAWLATENESFKEVLAWALRKEEGSEVGVKWTYLRDGKDIDDFFLD